MPFGDALSSSVGVSAVPSFQEDVMMISQNNILFRLVWSFNYRWTPSEQFFSYTCIMMKTNYILMRIWKCSFCTRQRCWALIVLVHWNKSSRVDILLHLDTLSWFWAKKTLIVIRNAVWLVEKQHIPIILVFGFDPTSAYKTWSTALTSTMFTITTPMQLICSKNYKT